MYSAYWIVFIKSRNYSAVISRIADFPDNCTFSITLHSSIHPVLQPDGSISDVMKIKLLKKAETALVVTGGCREKERILIFL